MAYKKTQRYTNDDYFNYVMSLKYSEAIEMLNWIGKTYNINVNNYDTTQSYFPLQRIRGYGA